MTLETPTVTREGDGISIRDGYYFIFQGKKIEINKDQYKEFRRSARNNNGIGEIQGIYNQKEGLVKNYQKKEPIKTHSTEEKPLSINPKANKLFSEPNTPSPLSSQKKTKDNGSTTTNNSSNTQTPTILKEKKSKSPSKKNNEYKNITINKSCINDDESEIFAIELEILKPIQKFVLKKLIELTNESVSHENQWYRQGVITTKNLLEELTKHSEYKPESLRTAYYSLNEIGLIIAYSGHPKITRKAAVKFKTFLISNKLINLIH